MATPYPKVNVQAEIQRLRESSAPAYQASETDVQSELERLRAENAQLKQRMAGPGRQRELMKVSEKGAVSFYIMGRKFPVSLRPEEWETVLSHVDEIREFVTDADTIAECEENRKEYIANLNRK